MKSQTSVLDENMAAKSDQRFYLGREANLICHETVTLIHVFNRGILRRRPIAGEQLVVEREGRVGGRSERHVCVVGLSAWGVVETPTALNSL